MEPVGVGQAPPSYGFELEPYRQATLKGRQFRGVRQPLAPHPAPRGGTRRFAPHLVPHASQGGGGRTSPGGPPCSREKEEEEAEGRGKAPPPRGSPKLSR